MYRGRVCSCTSAASVPAAVLDHQGAAIDRWYCTTSHGDGDGKMAFGVADQETRPRSQCDATSRCSANVQFHAMPRWQLQPAAEKVGSAAKNVVAYSGVDSVDSSQYLLPPSR